MSAGKAWIVYTLVRLLSILIPFGVLVAVGVHWIIALVLGTIIGLCVSYLFLRRQRLAMATALANRTAPKPKKPVDPDSDEAVEDADA